MSKIKVETIFKRQFSWRIRAQGSLRGKLLFITYNHLLAQITFETEGAPKIHISVRYSHEDFIILL